MLHVNTLTINSIYGLQHSGHHRLVRKSDEAKSTRFLCVGISLHNCTQHNPKLLKVV